MIVDDTHIAFRKPDWDHFRATLAAHLEEVREFDKWTEDIIRNHSGRIK